MPKKTSVRQFRISNFNGGMNTSAEDNALISLDPNGNLGIGFSQIQSEMRIIENFLHDTRGSLKKTSGFTLLKAAGTGRVNGIYRFIKSNGQSYFIVAHGSRLYKLESGILNDLGVSLSGNVLTHFETAMDTCIICDGQNSPFSFDGTTVSSLAGSPPGGAKQTLFYQNRLWTFSSSQDPSRLFFSKAGTINEEFNLNFVNCDTNDGQKITSIAKCFLPGELSPVILVGKERSVGIITGDGSSSAPYTFQKVSVDLGIAGVQQIVQGQDLIAFLTPQGLSAYQTSDSNISLKRLNLSESIKKTFAGVNQNYLANSFCWYDWKNNRISCALTCDTNQFPDEIWHYDLDHSSWTKQSGFSLTCAFVDIDGRLYHGDTSGNIYQHNTSVYHYNNTAIEGTIVTPYLDFFDATSYKKVLWASVTLRSNNQNSLGISTQMDFGRVTGSSHSINIPDNGYFWGSGTWSNNSSVYQWSTPLISTQKFYPRGIFRNIAFTFNQTGLDQSMDIFELNFAVEYLDLV